MTHKEIIEKLSRLDLSSYPEEEVKKLIKQLGSFGVIVTNLHPRKRILRGRINEKPHEYDNISKISYKLLTELFYYYIEDIIISSQSSKSQILLFFLNCILL